MQEEKIKKYKKLIGLIIGLLSYVIVSNAVLLSLVLIKHNQLNKLTDSYGHAQRISFSQTLELPVFSVNTEDNQEIVSKEEYLNCSVSVGNTDVYNFDNYTGKIKGRGNSTWTYPKKPYKLKFDSKVNLFGNGKSKTWTLIANYVDNSLIRNYLAYLVADLFDDLRYTTTVQFVDLYVNGSYEGVYLVCEQVQTGTNRVEISEDYSQVDTGYLLEMDDRAPDEGLVNKDYFVCEGKNFAIKSPDTEDGTCTAEHVQFISQYMQQCFDALKSNSYADVCSLLDVNSFADSYILNELFNCKDVNFSSFYLYKDAGQKLCSGPVWDYDLSAGNCGDNVMANSSQELFAATNIFYNYLLQFDEFKSLVATKLQQYETPVKNLIDNQINNVLNNYFYSFQRNFIRWYTLGQSAYLKSEQTTNITTWEGQLEFLKQWLHDSLDFVVSTYCAE